MSDAQQPIELRIDFSSMRKPADVGINRAMIFLGLVTNAMAIRPPVSHVLDDKVQYRLVPNEVPVETSDRFCEEFSYWVIGNALRELVESFSAFLVRCRPFTTLMETKRLQPDELRVISARIEMLNVRRQYQQMQEIIGLDVAYGEMFESFRQARNCLAHRRGVVSERDLNGEQYFRLRWCFLGLFLEDQDGTQRQIDNSTIGDGMETGPGGAKVIVRLTWRERQFARGDQIKLSRHDLSEICFGVHLATNHVIEKMHSFARVHGIPDANLDKAAEATSQSGSEAIPENLDRDD